MVSNLWSTTNEWYASIKLSGNSHFVAYRALWDTVSLLLFQDDWLSSSIMETHILKMVNTC